MNVVFHLLIVMIISIYIWKRRFYCYTKCLQLKLDLHCFTILPVIRCCSTPYGQGAVAVKQKLIITIFLMYFLSLLYLH